MPSRPVSVVAPRMSTNITVAERRSMSDAAGAVVTARRRTWLPATGREGPEDPAAAVRACRPAVPWPTLHDREHGLASRALPARRRVAAACDRVPPSDRRDPGGRDAVG